MSRAKQVAEETGTKVDTALALFVRNALERLKEIDKKGNYNQLVRGHDLLETFGFYRTTIMFPERVVKCVSEAIDPYGIFSDAKLISLALSQLLDETILQELNHKCR